MTKNKNARGDGRGHEPIVKPLAPAKSDGGGAFSRPFRVSDLPGKGVIWRKATSEESVGAANFRQMLRELSPDFDVAYRKVAGENPQEACAISDSRIDDLAGPILQEYGYDMNELILQRKTSRSVRKMQAARPTVFDLDLTEPYEELRKLQATLQWIARMERWSHKAAYCIPVRPESDHWAAFAPWKTWKEDVAGDQCDTLIAHAHRAYKSLAAVAGTGADFQGCRIVHFLPYERADLEIVPKLLRSPPKETMDPGNVPLVIVEGETVVAMLPRDEGKRVVSAIVAVETPQQGGPRLRDENQILPDMNAIIAHAEGAAALRAESLS